MKGLPAETDFVVAGAGVAGLRAAIELAEAGRVLVLAKDAGSQVPANNTVITLSDDDEVSLHLQDTLDAGDGLCNPAAAKILVEEGVERIQELLSWNHQFHSAGSILAFETDLTCSHSRVLHAHGESTGKEILHVLSGRAHALPNISFVKAPFRAELRKEDSRVVGLSLHDGTGSRHDVTCRAVLLATGGMGQLYRNTTNPRWNTGDGVAMAVRAGAEAGDMEFIQFHPTVLYLKKAPPFPLSEALRVEGGYLRNIELTRFMAKYHPMGELAPPDVIARAIVHEMEVSRARDPFVYLDLTHLDASKVRKRLARIHAACMQLNLDIMEDLIPVRPAAHYAMGGVRTDLDGRTTLAGLYAAGEAAAIGVHGANRLPGNSLLEGLVYGARAGKAMRDEVKAASRATTRPAMNLNSGTEDGAAEECIGQLQDLMWNHVGVVRTRSGMQKAIDGLEEIASRLTNPKTPRAQEAANLGLAALLVARSALKREETRGVHYRTDYPNRDDKKFLKHSVANSETVRFV